MKRIADLFPELKLNPKEKNIKVKGLARDFRNLASGDLFFILPGPRFDVFSQLDKAAQKAAVFVASCKLKTKLKALAKKRPIIFVKDIQGELIRAADIFYDIKGGDLKIVAVTGTNGKTTTSYLIYQLLESLNQPVSLIGTVRYRIGSRSYKSEYTTPEMLSLRKILKQAQVCGSKFVVMEVSSHALDQQRCRGIDFSSCVFTNLSRDHLDYHRTMANYFRAKKKLFSNNKNAVAVLNIDDPYARKIAKVTARKISYGTALGADIRAYDIELKKNGTQFKVKYKNKTFKLKTRLCGKHNVLNILAALASIVSLGFPIARAIEKVTGFGCVQGRLQRIGADIFVDYAHTPDALAKVLKALKAVGYQKIICAFGCGGQRDKGKRRLMGQVAYRYADFSFITSDNPRRENPSEICRQIKEGFTKKNYRIVLDRKKAIKESIDLLAKYKDKPNSETCLLVAGKGHEDYQIIKDKKIAFKDSRIIRSLIKD